MYIGMRFQLYISSPCSAFIRFLFLFSLCLFDLQLLFHNTCQKVMNGDGWPDDHHGLSPILYDTAPVFVYTEQLLCHCVFICSNFRKWLVYCMRWLLWCFCLLAESHETINHDHRRGSMSNFARMATDATKRKHYCKCKHFPTLSLT